MSTIFVKVPDAPGESTAAGFLEEIQCQGMQHGIDLPVMQHRATRIEGSSMHGSIRLIHNIDSATPKLRSLALNATMKTPITISRTRLVSDVETAVETITLKNAYVAQVNMLMRLNETGDGPADMPLEEFTLDYETITWDYKYVNSDSEQSTVSAEYQTITPVVAA
jgi:type VI secretion system Hcp family effector